MGDVEAYTRSKPRLKTRLAAAGAPSTSSSDSSLTLRLNRLGRTMGFAPGWLENSPNAYLDNMPLQVTPLQERLVAQSRAALWILQGAVLFVLLMASATHANLLRARAAVRRKEIAISCLAGCGTGALQGSS